MTKRIRTIDKTSAKLIRQVCQRALERTLAEAGLTVTCAGITMDRNGKFCSMRVNLALDERDASGVRLSPESEAFKRHCAGYGLRPEHLGREFATRQGRFRVVGLNPRRTRFPVVTESVTELGRRMMWRAADVAELLGAGVKRERESRRRAVR